VADGGGEPAQPLPCVYVCGMSETERLIVTLDAEHAARLTLLAQREHADRGTLARSLLSAAIDEGEPDAAAVTGILDRIRAATARRSDSADIAGWGSAA
jgi:hypothetical protein